MKLAKLLENIVNDRLNEADIEASTKKVAADLDALIQAIPTLNITEKWGDADSDDREQIKSFINIYTKGASDPVDKIRKFLQGMDSSVQTSPGKDINKIFNKLVLMRTIYNIVTGFNPSGAGFIFEALTAAIMDGKQQIEKDETGQLGIADVEVAGQPYSMKLLSGKSRLKGSLTNLTKDVNNGKTVTYIIMTRETTTGGKISFYSGTVDKSNIKKFKKNAADQAKNKHVTNPQFVLSYGSWATNFNDYQLIGILDVDASTIRTVVKNSLQDIQSTIDPVFSSLKDFTVNLYKYFGSTEGKKRSKQAAITLQSAKKLDTNTSKVVK